MSQRAHTVRRLGVPIAIAAAALVADFANATGFFINQQSVVGRGRVDAGNSAAADDLATIFFNPAALVAMFADGGAESRFSGGIQLIVPRSTQRNAGTTASAFGAAHAIDGPESHNPTDPTPVPNFYWAHRLGMGALGFGINVPFGLDEKAPADWFGRYDAIEAALRTVNLTAVGAWPVADNVAIGGGLDVQYANTKLVTAIPDPLALQGPTPATDGRVETRGHAWTLGYNLGVHYTSSDRQTRLGAHYRSGMKHEIRGSATFSNVLPPFDVYQGVAVNGTHAARADLELPAIATAGAWHSFDRLALMAELEWYQWSKFHEVRTRIDGLPDAIRLTNYRDTFGVAVGADYRADPRLTLRGGVKYDRTPTRDGFRDTTVPDSDRLWLGLGATWQPARGPIVDFALNHVFFRDTAVDVTRSFFDGTPAATTVRTRGDVRSVVNTIAVAIRCVDLRCGF